MIWTEKILGRELNKVVAQYASTRPYITKVYLMDKNRKIITPELRGEQVDKFLNITKNGKKILKYFRRFIRRAMFPELQKFFLWRN